MEDAETYSAEETARRRGGDHQPTMHPRSQRGPNLNDRPSLATFPSPN